MGYPTRRCEGLDLAKVTNRTILQPLNKPLILVMRTRWNFMTVLVVGLLSGPSLNSQTVPTPKPVMDFSLRFEGMGSWPDPDARPSSQQWVLDHTYSGRFETVNEPKTFDTPSGPRTRLAISWSPDGIDLIQGTMDDRAVNHATERGEGGSTMKYMANETWSANASLPVSELLMNLSLDTEARVWNGGFEVGLWGQRLRDETQYEGVASLTPGEDGGAGFGDPWYFATTDPRSAQEDGKQVYTRYHPRWPPTTNLKILDVPAEIQDGEYTGRLEVELPKPPGAPGSWQMKATFRWKLVDPLPEVELKVWGLGYSEWRPTLREGLNPGRELSIAATVESPKGERLDRIRVKKFTWTLHETSREPGVAMNFPRRENAKTDPDLRIAGIPTSDDGQKGEEVPAEGDLGSVIDLVPYDWGGWATLRVQAELEDGRVIQGTMKGGPVDGRSDIPIPYRADGSKVADVWLKERGLSGGSDTTDDDPQPVGKPGADGDGLTVYEEYRGFYVKGEHRSTDPLRKDLFVSNQEGAIARGAVGRFRRVSQLEVHLPEISEFDPFFQNQINFNRAQGPTRGPQGGLLLRPSSLFRGNATAATRPGTHGRVVVPRALRDVPQRVANNATTEHIVMQEMFRALGVERPGPDDSMKQFELVMPPPGSSEPPEILMVPNTRVVVLDFFGDDFARKWQQQIAGPLSRIPHRIPAGTSAATAADLSQSQRQALTRFRWLVGEKGGAHSGPENCVMRDWFADVYRSRVNAADGRPIYRLVDPARGAEQPGTRLGTGRKGTGVNAPDRQPEPRYGDSEVSAPANRQMVVRDSAP